MSGRRMNPNLIKLHRTYDVPELARCCQVHKNTVLNWQKVGLEPIDGSKPMLFHGSAVREFFKKKRAKWKQPCGPGKFYCFRCREPRTPALGLVEYAPLTLTSGNLKAFCKSLPTVMHRRACRIAALAVTMPNLDVQVVDRALRLIGGTSPSLNCNSERQAAARRNSMPKMSGSNGITSSIWRRPSGEIQRPWIRCSSRLPASRNSTRRKDFKSFHRKQAVAFKQKLSGALNARTGERLSKATLHSILRDLHAFFFWLAHLPGYFPRQLFRR